MRKFVQWYAKYPAILLSMLLLIKIVLFRQLGIHDLSLWGVVSDIAAMICLMALPAIFLRGKSKAVLQYIIAGLLSLIWFATSIYYSYYGSIPTYLTLTHMNQVSQVSESVTSAIEPYMIFYFVDFIILALMTMIWGRKIEVRSHYWTATTRKQRPKLRALIIFTLSLIVCGTIVFTARNIENEHALANRLGVITYQFVVLGQGKTNSGGGMTEKERAESQALIQEWFADRDVSDNATYHGVAEGRNLIVVQLESFQNFVIGLKVGDQEITPNLNALIKDSFYFPRMYQQIGEGNTSDAEFILNTGVYPLGAPNMSSFVGGKEVPSLPRTLATQGYDSYTFHVNDVSFWNRNEMYPALGFDKYFDSESFVNDHFNSFGASDKEFYRVIMQEFEQFKKKSEPFYAQLITTSSHHPFIVPKEDQHLVLPSSYAETQLGNYLQAIRYTDEQLGIFIQHLKDAGMWEQSMIAIYGDHSGLQPKENDPDWVSEQLGIPYHDTISRLNIPFILSIPGVEGEVIDTIAGQVDMLPTIYNVLGIDTNEHAQALFGTDLLNTETNIVGTRYYMPTGTFFNDNVLFVPGLGFNDGVATDLKTFENVEVGSNLRSDYDYIMELMEMSDLYSRQLPMK
ncbi:MAG: LTA synthase family protein [Candidatus Pristimantibacillus lignocellulolyticus]|uniref:LTA synthase family protein n=1 Tax=Candidatus Pristimantibacillus lignocellulolyticus TaxID=2994561 RepID=A0A9J6ZK35_9BACL|nr:MAG: LTA synthase family protein [Candidatus Pristimantibacillus lignocellulolyticus]